MNSNWPSPIEKKLEPFHKRESELAIENGCMFWGSKMVIPKELQSAVPCELHEGHPGMTKMKNLARTRVWWPNMDREIEETVRKCLHCQNQRSEAAQAPVHPWEFPAKPWNRLHIDFAGPLHGFHWLFIVDARTKWPEDISPQPRSPNPNLSRPPHVDQTKLVHPSRRSERLNKGVVPKRLIEECQAVLRRQKRKKNI
ncbi:hypothetical protein J437_LFUL018551 [Ladona fulva]|uniref:RNA-directed DNA polymerase n=1 Tax=Ladona fulva TaxID=123851 RepID=A0A8K0PB91_LADFU|nr:hypothetical protein J437_LFUL018551 [Ladona fulva]